MFRGIGRVAYTRRKTIAAAWAVVLVVGMMLSGPVMSRLTAEADRGDVTESSRVAHRVKAIAGNGPEVVAVVGGVSVDDPSVRQSVQAATAAIAAMPGVVAVHEFTAPGADALVAEDGRAGLVVARLDRDLDGTDAEAVADRVAARVRAVDAPSVKVGGSAVIEREFHRAIEKDLSAETKAIPVAFVVMIVVLGGLIAAGLPLLVAFAAVGGAMFVLMAATGVTDVSLYAMNVVFMFGIGLGIDYGLLVVGRFREERAAGATIPKAVERSVTHAGRTVVFSGLTVTASLAGLFAFDDPVFRSFGVAGIGVVLTSMAAAVTLLPALLAMWGRRIKPAATPKTDRGYFAAVARLVQRRPLAVVAGVGVALAAVAVPFASARFENGDARYLPRSSESRAVALLLGERFPARGAEPIVVVADADRSAPAVIAYVADLGSRAGVAHVAVWPHAPHGTTVVELVPEGTTQGDVAQRLVRDIRDDRPGFAVEVGGPAAMLVDTKQETTARLPIAFGVMVLATLVLLFLMTGSVAVPIKAVAMNVLSLGATFGALVWGFQEGHLAGVLGFDPVGSLDVFMPVLIFIFAFGLSMDYEVFLLARIKEIYDETGDNDYAVAAGLQRTGGIVTSAALLIVLVFAGFAMGEVLGIKQLGFGLALAVVVDATVVRTLLVPATMKLLGDWNWWAPRPLRKLHDRFGLHEAPAPAAA